jgi:hypothetical protein
LYPYIQSTPEFERPYDSREIGMAKVAKISLKAGCWGARDVFSKCVIVPSEIREKSNPLPTEVLEAHKDDIDQVYKEIMGNEFLTWNVHSLLLPSDIVLKKMCEKYPMAKRSQKFMKPLDSELSSDEEIISDGGD